MQPRRATAYLFSAALLLSAASLRAEPAPAARPDKPRIIVLTDVSNEPDDEMSLVRFLLYTNELDVEGLVATTSRHLRDKTRVDIIRKFVETYGSVRDNLLVHAPGWPTTEQLLAVTKAGNSGFGMAGVGDGKSSDGSRLIIEAADRADPRPLWVTVWGGPNTLAQALFDAQKTRSKAQFDALVAKLRVYTISDQDDSGAWLRKTFPGLYYIASPGTDYHESTWSGISGDRFYKNGPGVDFELVDNAWLDANIRKNHGPLGALYPWVEYIMEGDTPSFLNLIDNGLAGHVDPNWGGWGGRYEMRQPFFEPRAFYTTTRDTIALPWPGKPPKGAPTWALEPTSAQASVWRWRRAYQHDFAARMDWTSTKDRKAANHNPVVVVNGDQTKAPILLTGKKGDKLTVSARGTFDPDGHKLAYRWFVYPEPGSLDREVETSIAFAGANGPDVSFVLPEPKHHKKTAEGTMHVILEVKDSGTPALYAYRRVIVTVQP